MVEMCDTSREKGAKHHPTKLKLNTPFLGHINGSLGKTLNKKHKNNKKTTSNIKIEVTHFSAMVGKIGP